MKNIYKILLPLLMVMVLILSGCTANTDEDPNVDQDTDLDLGLEVNGAYTQHISSTEVFGDTVDTVALIHNEEAVDESLDIIPTEAIILNQESPEKMILIPKFAGSTIEIISVEYNEDDFTEMAIIHSYEDIADGFILHITAIRPEGAPNTKIKITMPDEEKTVTEYYISYNGNTGTPAFEVITMEEE